jgi:hypothetical protein
METWKHGDIDIETWKWRHGDIESWRHGDMETGRHGDMEAWRHGYGHGDMEIKKKLLTETQVIFFNQFTVCSSCKRKFVICPFVDEETNGS